MTELALDPSDESLLVSREKVNGHIYHMFKDAQVTLPEPVGGQGTQQWVGRVHNSGWAGYTTVGGWGTRQWVCGVRDRVQQWVNGTQQWVGRASKCG